ncbi:MAG: NUDIX domain-containing protein [Nanohaloarchaea archaeon]|nr:NUDIX domain-containing protein [Candidatus Nanohaloarchaea archaeon]
MKPTRFAATAYIIFKDKVLLINHPKIKRWLPVGGKVDPDETPDQAVLREIKEEVGLDVKIMARKEVLSNKVVSYRYAQLEDLGKKFHFDFIYYARSDIDTIKLDAEISEAKWFTYTDYLKIKDELFDDVKKELEIIYLQEIPYNPYMLINKENIDKIKDNDFEIVVVNHCDTKTERFIQQLKQLFDTKIYFICKKYSYNETSAKNISQMTENKDFFDTDTLISELNKHDKKILVFDLSGIFYNVTKSITNLKRICLIEDTKNGLNIHNDDVPRISIATSNLKKLIENPLVAKGIFDAFITYSRDYNYEFGLNKRVLILGTGSIGSYLLNILEKRFTHVCGYDIDILTSAKMLLANHDMIKDIEKISTYDIIFGTTGDDSALDINHLKILKDNVFLINCSTNNSEFSQEQIKKHKITKEGLTEIIKINDKTINLLNLGNPINFYKQTGTDRKAIDTVFAYMIDSLVEWMINSKQKATVDISADDIIQKETSEKYIRYFFNSYVR